MYKISHDAYDLHLWIKEVREQDRRIIILMHIDADPDAIGSAYFLNTLFNKHPATECIVIGNIKRNNLDWMHKGINITSKPPKNWDKYSCIVVDTRTPVRLPIDSKHVLKNARSVLIIDHHSNIEEEAFKALNPAITVISDDSHSSCCQYVCKLVQEYSMYQPQPFNWSALGVNAFTSLLGGIYLETNKFNDPYGLDFFTVHYLISRGADFKEVINQGYQQWWKLNYMAQIIKDSEYHKDAKIVIMASSPSELRKIYPQAIYAAKGYNKAPIWLLSLLRRENFKYRQSMNGFILLYDKEDNSNKRISVIVDLSKWSQVRQDKLGELGFKIIKQNQYRFYNSYELREVKEAIDKIKEILMLTDNV